MHSNDDKPAGRHYVRQVLTLERPQVTDLPDNFTRWFAQRGWTPRAHQLELLDVARAGRSALLIAPTGAGKTLAGFLPTLVELSEAARARLAPSPYGRSAPLPPRSGGEGSGMGGTSANSSAAALAEAPPDPSPPPAPRAGGGERTALAARPRRLISTGRDRKSVV